MEQRDKAAWIEKVDKDCTHLHAYAQGGYPAWQRIGFVVPWPKGSSDYGVCFGWRPKRVYPTARQACDYLHAYRLMNGMNEDGTEV